ncbi:MAG TPA: DUF1553 domain-containing protein [Verrucomicrobiales bacterium]|nr:DUF1553 domain-containing protein [Verrucomicrobiales bacterium]
MIRPNVTGFGWMALALAVAGAAGPVEGSEADSGWWSWRPLARPEPPAVSPQHAARVRTPVDAFVLARLEAEGLGFSPEASRRVLIRRLSYDLTGLPPEPGETEAFVSDLQPGSWERLVDRLLASPRYGERWARHWLDVAHYADTHGYDKDKPRPNAWPYRDLVIRSLNADKPYSRFVQEQLAGDVLWPDDPDAVAATGFIAAGPWDFIGHAEVPEEKRDGMVARNLDRDDMVASTMNTFSSLTVQCARCHDHKRDPVSMKEYYGLQAVFAALDRADRPWDPDPELARQRRLIREQSEAREIRRKEIEMALARQKTPELLALEMRIAGMEARIAAAMATSPETGEGREASPIPEQVPDAGEDDVTLLERLREEQESLLRAAAGPELLAARDEIESEIARLNTAAAALPPQEMVYAGTVYTGSGAFLGRGHVNGEPRPIRVLVRGDVTRPGPVAVPGAVGLIPGVAAAFPLGPGRREGDRRAALAEWIIRKDNPLTWRSIVNRIWLHHFGQGLVDTPNDFGRLGGAPTHPELLDWLAVEFRDSGGSWKRLHRLICTSGVYLQDSAGNPAAERVDVSNRLLWRMNRRRLEAEAVRDSLLWTAQGLDHRMYGPGFQDFAVEKPEHSPHYVYDRADPGDPALHRRAVYRFTVRSQPQPWMQVLDCADPSLSVAQREQSAGPLQALALMNDRFLLAVSEQAARRAASERFGIEEQVKWLWQRCCGRSPEAAELDELADYARRFGLPAACRLLFNLNEFVFVD